MKKLFFVLAGLLVLAVSASAQSRALGVRGNFGGGVELSYQGTMGHGRNYIETDLGVAFGNGSFGVDLATSIEFVLAHPGNFNFLSGPGAMVCMVFAGGNVGFVPGVLAQLGVEYAFPNTPLNISVDWRPNYMFYQGYSGVALLDIGIGLRYRF